VLSNSGQHQVGTCTLLNCQFTIQPQYHHGDQGISTAGRTRTLINGFGDHCSAIELRPLVPTKKTPFRVSSYDLGMCNHTPLHKTTTCVFPHGQHGDGVDAPALLRVEINKLHLDSFCLCTYSIGLLRPNVNFFVEKSDTSKKSQFTEIVVPIKIQTDRKTTDDLGATLRACNTAANYIFTVAWEGREFSKFGIQRLTYAKVKEEFGLGAQDPASQLRRAEPWRLRNYSLPKRSRQAATSESSTRRNRS